ncbi:MAG: response regulator transcription factor [Chloroflexi bacterium]|nr:response regulator transcription factor [Chloroflexota bacterium]
MANERILVVDDEANIRDLASLYLEQAGYVVESAADGRQALDKIAQNVPDLVVLDLMLPVVDGWEVCRKVRAEYEATAVLMLTARDDDIDKIVGLEMGADDYMTKPFNPRELVARVRAILRRATAVPTAAGVGDVRQLGRLQLSPASREVMVNGQRVPLRAKEFDLLLTLLDHANQVLSRDQLLDLVWGYEYYGNTRTVDVHVAHLREKLIDSELHIETVWGMGYKLMSGEK